MSRDKRTVVYSSEHWNHLWRMRERASDIVSSLGILQESTLIHGSLARGDVDEQSDIDILIETVANTQLVEHDLLTRGFEVYEREIAQATPLHTPKAHIYLDLEHKTTVTVPLTPLRKLESEFYRFGGATVASRENSRARVPGCTKRLTLIEPNETGHVESRIVGQEASTARLLRVNPRIIEERLRVLERRDKIGRTGVFLRISVPEDMSFEEALRKQAKENPALRRTLRLRGF